jgi:hypothetical protein
MPLKTRRLRLRIGATVIGKSAISAIPFHLTPRKCGELLHRTSPQRRRVRFHRGGNEAARFERHNRLFAKDFRGSGADRGISALTGFVRRS